MIRRLGTLLFLMMLLSVLGCAAKPAPQTAIDNPLERPPTSAPAGPLNPDRTCKTHADCTVKDVGNCCGTYPQCVNGAAKVDPKAVQAQCAKSGMASVCGFPVIRGCQCVRGQCTADNSAER